MSSLKDLLSELGVPDVSPLEQIERELRAIYLQISQPNSPAKIADGLQRFAAELEKLRALIGKRGPVFDPDRTKPTMN